MEFQAIDTTRTQESLIVVLVQDSLTERPPLNSATIKLFYRTENDEPERPYPLAPRQYANGQFVFAGELLRAFPDLSGGEVLPLQLLVEAPRYQPQTVDFTLTEDMLAMEEVEIQIGDLSTTASHLNVPIERHNVSLSPRPLHLSGRVVDDHNPDTPIVGAEVSIVAPQAPASVMTDGNGFFTLTDLPVEKTIVVRIISNGPVLFAERETEIVLNYREAVNQRLFTLERVDD